jgi:GR25 family glycosyltransferase involved in LPS biosynthesis
MKGLVINLDGRPDRYMEFLQQEFPFPVERIRAIKSKIGEDGCTQSHLLALRSIKEFPTVVFEDDAVMLHPWDHFVQAIMMQLPLDYDALWLGANLQAPLKQYSPNLYELKDAYCLHAVIYNSQEMVDYILENHNTPSGKNLDIFYHSDVFDKFRCFITYPMCATQRAGVSNICNDYTDFAFELQERFEKMTKG